MSDQQSQPTPIAQDRPAPDGSTSWPDYWKSQGMPWRTEPEIDEERQRYLDERRAVTPDAEKGIYPFGDENSSITLTRADVEWLLATHESEGMRGPVNWNDETQRHRTGVDLCRADLRGVDLSELPLARVRGGQRPSPRLFFSPGKSELERAAAHLEGANLYFTQLQGADFEGAHFEEADLRFARLEQANFAQAHLEGAALGAVFDYIADRDVGGHLEGANLVAAHLEGADLARARLQGANLITAHLEGADLSEAHLEGTNLTSARFDDKTNLTDVSLARTPKSLAVFLHRKEPSTAMMRDIHWGGVDLTRVMWGPVQRLGDEQVARSATDRNRYSRVERSNQLERAARANRQVATRLYEQGLKDYADRFAYRANLCERGVFGRRFQVFRWLSSFFLDLISGYGYRPIRSFIAYILVILGFAAGYFALGGANGQFLSWNEAIVISMTAFHGRGFFSAVFQPGDLQAAVAAVEAFIGLLIEIVLIATFTQRFFAR